MENFDPITASAEFAAKLKGPTQPAQNVVSRQQFGKPGKEEPPGVKEPGTEEFGTARKLVTSLEEAA